MMAALRSNSMNLHQLLAKVPSLAGHYNPETCEPLLGAGEVQDYAARFLINRLDSTFDPEKDGSGQVTDAIHTVLGVVQVVDNVRRNLIAALKSMEEDKELAQAQAALAQAKTDKTMAWEECKAALGLNAKPGYVVDGYDTRAKILVQEGQPLRYLTPNQIRYSSSIGKLLEGGKFVCHKCALSHDLVAENATSVFPVNIIPYSQDCHDCGQSIVEGWDCMLYDAPKSQWAVIRFNINDQTPWLDMASLSDSAEDAEYSSDYADERSPELASQHPVVGVVAVEGGE